MNIREQMYFQKKFCLEKQNKSERRVILDFSFPKGMAINDHISKTECLDRTMELIFPKVDDFVQLIKA